MVHYVFEPIHARFDFTLEGCADDEDLNSNGDLPQCSPSDSIMAMDLSGERVFINPPWELAEKLDTISRIVDVHLQNLRWLYLFNLS
jgi:hypothetical protein